MTDNKFIPKEVLLTLTEATSIESLSTEQILSSFRNDRRLNTSSTTVQFAVDPRSGEPTIFNPSRAGRPHDYPVESGDMAECPICAGQSTGILDLAELKEGFSFINKNLYPVINPPDPGVENPVPENFSPRGLHFVQWTSSFHNKDWHNLPDEDCLTVLSRLAALEEKLCSVARDLSKPGTRGKGSSTASWYISIIKNVGSAVGGSLEHGHQQIVLANAPPRRIVNNQKFLDKRGEVFSSYVLSSNPSQLLLRDYGPAILLVPEFMRRPYEMILLPRVTSKTYIHDLDRDEMKAVAGGWKDAICAIRRLLPAMNKDIAFNVITHNGPGAGLYFEFLPYTQEQGGLEQLGLSICQMEPARAVDNLREAMG